MDKLLKFELFKIIKQKKFLNMIVSVCGFQLLMAIFVKYNPDFMSYEKAIKYSFLSHILVNINLIFLSCNMFAEDFEYLTITHIKIKFPNVFKLILVKLFVIFLVHVLLLFLSSIFTIIFSLALLKFNSGLTIFTNMLVYNFSTIIPLSILILLLAIVILLTRKEKSGLILGLLIYMFYGFGTGFHFLIIKKLSIFKYSIINLLNLPNQILDNRYIELTRLSSQSMILVSIIYLIFEIIILYKLSKSLEV